MDVKFPRRLWIIRSPVTVAYQVCKNEEELSTEYLSVVEHNSRVAELAVELSILKNPSDGRCMEIAALRLIKKERDSLAAENLRLREALEEIERGRKMMESNFKSWTAAEIAKEALSTPPHPATEELRLLRELEKHSPIVVHESCFPACDFCKTLNQLDVLRAKVS